MAEHNVMPILRVSRT